MAPKEPPLAPANEEQQLEQIEAVSASRWKGFFKAVPPTLEKAVLALLGAIAMYFYHQVNAPTQGQVDQERLKKSLSDIVEKGVDRVEKGLKRSDSKMDRVAEQMEAVTNTLAPDKRLQVRDQMARYDKRRDDRERGN